MAKNSMKALASKLKAKKTTSKAAVKKVSKISGKKTLKALKSTKAKSKPSASKTKRVAVWKHYDFKSMAKRLNAKALARGKAKPTAPKANAEARSKALKNWHEKMKNPQFRKYTRERQADLRARKKKLGIKSTEALYAKGKVGGRRPAVGKRKKPIKSKWRSKSKK